MKSTMTDMPNTAKVYVSGVMFTGLVIAVFGAAQWHTENWTRFAVLCLLAMAGAGVKTRLAWVKGTYSLSFVFVLAGIPNLTLSELIAIVLATAPVQCLWRARKEVDLTQLLFNAAGLTISTALAHSAYASTFASTAGRNEVLCAAAAAASVYWVVNTGLIAILLALLKQGSFGRVWEQWCLWSFPYYLAGAAIAALISGSVRQNDWRAALLFMPLVLLVTVCYRVWVGYFNGDEGRMA